MPNSILEKPWIYILVDFITKLPLAQGYDSILVVVDRLTKIVHFILTIERTIVERLVLQTATYWFVIGWFNNQSAQKGKVRQAAKDIVKSEVYP